MALIGKIMTLFSDEAKTTPVFPRTKVSAVSDENGVGLDGTLNEINQTLESLGTQVTYTLDGTTLIITPK